MITMNGPARGSIQVEGEAKAYRALKWRSESPDVAAKALQADLDKIEKKLGKAGVMLFRTPPSVSEGDTSEYPFVAIAEVLTFPELDEKFWSGIEGAKEEKENGNGT